MFFWVFAILAANAMSGLVIRSLRDNGAAAAIGSTFGVSAIVWAALAAGLVLLGRSRDGPEPRGADAALAAIVCLAAFLPMANLSGVAMTVFAFYAIWTSAAGSPVRRAAIIFLAVTVSLIWGRLFLGLFSRELLFIDAFFATEVIGSTQTGNKIAFIGAPGAVIVAPGCSSLQGMSLAFVFWATVTQYYRSRITIRSLAWCGAALLAALAINVARLAALVNFPHRFEEIHSGWGAQLAAWTTMAAIVAIVTWGARHDVFAPR